MMALFVLEIEETAKSA